MSGPPQPSRLPDPGAEDQRDAVTFLRDPCSYGAGVERVETVETHISIVFLAGKRAYKLKRAVKFPYLDFTTVERRRAACVAELALNRRTAPDLYLEIRGLVRAEDGRVRFASAGKTAGNAIDWVVVMRRFDPALLFDALAQAGRLDPPLTDALADHIARFHTAAERRSEHGGAAAMRAIADESWRCLVDGRAAGFSAERIERLRRAWHDRLAVLAPLLERRRAEGKVRLVHGDLHLRNICLFEGRPTLFDCIEFSETIASIDVLYDLAFLLMDLEHRGLGGFANRVFNRYLDLTGEDDGLAAMPLFLSLRAAIRAHVTAAALARAADDADRRRRAAEARVYFDLAERLLAPRPARLVAVGGLSGSGKSTLAAALAPDLGTRPGARVLRSDVIRKRLFGVAPETRLPPTAYTSEMSRQVYRTLCERAAAVLAAGYAAIVDAVALRPAEREAFAMVAQRAGVAFSGLWLDAPATAMADRIRARRGDASDASPEILARQLQQDPGAIDWTRITAGGGPDAALAAARRALGLD